MDSLWGTPFPPFWVRKWESGRAGAQKRCKASSGPCAAQEEGGEPEAAHESFIAPPPATAFDYLGIQVHEGVLWNKCPDPPEILLRKRES